LEAQVLMGGVLVLMAMLGVAFVEDGLQNSIFK
jgi:hypothetical protein